MSYPGNASLAQDIQNRILDTFQQTLDLVESQSLQEAKLGCDFILRLDPMFEPARWLQDRLGTADGEIVLDDLKEAIEAARPAEADDGADGSGDEPEPAGEAAAEEDDRPASDESPESDETPESEEAPGTEEAPEAEDSPEPEESPEIEEAPGLDESAEPDEAPEADEAPSETDDRGDDVAEAEADDVPEPEEPEEPELPEAESEPEAEVEAGETAGGGEEPAITQATAFGDEKPPPEPASVEEVMAAPVAALDTESERRVHDLLAEGQTAFDNGEYQTAIDAWSRIFLIDIDHPEASERIEAARKLKAEAERTVEEAFHEALNQVESGATEEGRAGLEKVLEMQPDHLAAREQLERLDSGAAAAPAAPAPPASDAAEPAEGADADSALTDIDDSLDLDRPAPSGEIDAKTAIPIPKPRKQPKKKADLGDRKKVLLYVGAGLLALVLVGGWFLVSNWSKIFPNTAETVEAVGERPNPIERAEELHASGKTSTAIAQLKRLPPQHELYSEAQALVAQWEAAAEAETEDVEPTDSDLAEFESLLDRAQTASARGEFLRVDELLTRAEAIRPLDGDAAALKTLAGEELEPLRTLVAIFRQGEWELVLRDLWRLREDMPDNPDVNRLMIDSYYNLGVRALQRGDTGSAVGHFGEALELTGNDAELVRASKFAQTYRDRPEDLLYRIYVKYLPFR